MNAAIATRTHPCAVWLAASAARNRFRSLPGFHRTAAALKQGVRIRGADPPPTAPERRCATSQLSRQVLPLVLELTGGHGERHPPTYRADLRRIKCVATCAGLGMDAAQVLRYCRQCCPMTAEAMQLRMGSVAAGLPAQHRLRQQRFAPQGHEPACIEIARMQRPEAHARNLSRRAPEESP